MIRGFAMMVMGVVLAAGLAGAPQNMAGWESAGIDRGSFEDARFTYVDFSDVVPEYCNVRGLVINGVRIDELID